MTYKIENISSADINQCAKILKDEYNSNTLNEGWTSDCARKLCEFVLCLQPDLFFVAKNGDEVIGFTFSFIKPWAGGNCMMLEEICVKKNYRKNGIAKSLLKNAISTALNKYKIILVRAETYGELDEMPFSWYKRIGFAKEEKTFGIEGNPSTIKLLLNN